MKLLGVAILSILFLATAASAAVIQGSVYDLELNTLSQAVVGIDTTPQQVMVSKNGTYRFSVPPGSYIITARHAKLDLLSSEHITVAQEGEYVLDLILFPDIETEAELLNETLDVPEYYEPPGRDALIAGIIALVVLAAGGAAYWYWRLRKKQPTQETKRPAKADLEEILAFVRREGGRTTQKDLRKAIPYSEAKISLMIAELESQGKLKKIKKGRGNIIILP
jgi:uncharacterized membrane protein